MQLGATTFTIESEAATTGAEKGEGENEELDVCGSFAKSVNRLVRIYLWLIFASAGLRGSEGVKIFLTFRKTTH